MKKIICLLLVLCTFVVNIPHARAEISVSAKSAILIDADTKRVLFEKDAYTTRAMASTTKIMTALLCLEREDRDEIFKVDTNAIQVEGSSMGLIENDEVSLSTLAAGMLCLSGNDAANAAAVKIGGSKKEFCALMNERAKQIGMKSTSFETPSGLDGENHYSTAYDMALLGAEAIKNSEFLEICSEPKYTVYYSGKRRTYTNHNRLLRELEGCIGIKTGFTKKAGRCLVSAVKRSGRTLICVTLSAPNDWQDHKALYSYGFSMYNEEKLKISGDLSLSVVNSQKTEVSLTPQLLSDSIYVRAGEKISYEISARPFEYAPVYKGQVMGELSVLADGCELMKVALVANESAHHLYQKRNLQHKTPFERLIEWLSSLFK